MNGAKVLILQETNKKKMPKNDIMISPASLGIDEIIWAAKNFEVPEEGKHLANKGKSQVARW
jgi:hypothetical protein